jgi:hypothetical protein
MLLRSITKHVKNQNWFAVFLDFFIVVAGILIAFQITNWNEGRSAVKTEHRLIERLTNDLSGMQVAFLNNDEIAMRTHKGWMDAFRALERCKSNREHKEAIDFSLSQYQTSRTIPIQRSAFDEMQATGAFSRLADIGLKNEIVTLYSNMEGESTSDVSGRNNQLAAGRIMWKSIAFSYADDNPYAEDAQYSDALGVAVFDPIQHCDNLELRGAVWEMVDLNRDWLNSSMGHVAAIESILTRLKELE